MADRGLRAVRDDELLGGDPVCAEDPLDRELDPLARQRLAVEHERPVRVGVSQHVASDVEGRLARPLCAPEAVDLRRGLAAAPVLEQLAVDADLDPVRAEMVGELEREARRHDRVADSELRARPRVHLELDERRGHAAGEQLVEPERLRRERLELRRGGGDTRNLERADDHDAAAAPLRVEERVGHGDRHLVAHLRRAHRVGEDEDVAHTADPMSASSRASRSLRTPTNAPASYNAARLAFMPAAVFRPDEEPRLRELLDAMERPVELVVALGPEETPLPGAGDFDFSAETVKIVEALAALSGRVTSRVERLPEGVPRFPAVLVLPAGEDVGLRYYGTPYAYELASLVGAVLEAGRPAPSLAPESLERLAALDRDLAIDVFVTPT